MSASRHIENLKEKLSAFFQDSDFSVEPIPGGASSRRYYKIRFSGKSYFPADTILLMTIPPEEESVLSDYMNINYYLRRFNVPTPRLFEINKPEGWIFTEYQDSPTLENYFKNYPQKINSVLPKLVDFLFSIQKKCLWKDHCPAFRRRFDYEKYMFEFNFHVQEQLLSFHYQKRYDAEIIRNFAHEISSVLNISLPVFVHRDFQSSNIFYDTQDSKEPFRIIDFQDARHGTPVYDLISCLWDSYVPITEDLKNELLKEYFSRLPEFGVKWNWKDYEKMVDYTVIQRKLHDAGAFAFNYRRFNSPKYVGYIQSAVGMALEKIRKYPQFSGAEKIFGALLVNG